MIAIANGLTGLRLVSIPLFAYWMSQASTETALPAAILITFAIGTDLLDGPVARRMGQATEFGRAFDHTTDFLFVTAGLTAGALRGAFPVLLPIVIAIAFAQYVMSSLGRVNGILYFFPLCGDLLARLGVFERLGLDILEPAVVWLSWTLVGSTLLSILDRARALSREARDSRVAGTEGQSPR